MKPFVSSETFTFWCRFSFFFLFIVTICTYLFRDEILILTDFRSRFSRWETIFRIHYCSYSEKYEKITCHRNLEWKNQICLLCESMATNVHFPCGHIGLCSKCYRKRESKSIENCIICGQTQTSVRKILI